MQTSEPIQAWRMTRHEISGSRLVGFGFAVLALLSLLFVPLLIGLILCPLFAVLSYACDIKKRPVPYCGHCGTDVSPLTTLCPYCQAHLHTPPKRIDWVSAAIGIGCITIAIILLIYFIFRPAAYMP